jgi:hypothetical protein
MKNVQSRLIFAWSLATLALAGCGGNSNPVTGPGIRAVNGLSSESQAVVSDGSVVISSLLPYGSCSGTPNAPYAIVPTGTAKVTLANVGTPSTAVASVSLSVSNVGLHFDEIAYNPAAPTFLSLMDNFSVPSNCNVRFANASTVAGNVDVILTPSASMGPAVKFTLAPGAVGPVQPSGSYAYQSYANAGACALQVFPAGQDSGTPLISETINLPQGSSYTYVLLDPQASGQGEEMLEIQDNQLYDSTP